MRRLLPAIGLAVSLLGLAACTTGSPRPKPAELPAITPTIAARQVWTAQLGTVDFPLSVRARPQSVVVAGGNGTVTELEIGSGRGAFTRELISRMSPDSQLDICEIKTEYNTWIEQLISANTDTAGRCRRLLGRGAWH